MIGIIGAMDKEIDELRELMLSESDNQNGCTVTRMSSMDFYQGTLYGHEVVLVRSGVGKVNAACAAQILITYFKVRAIINTGIAGSLNADIDIGDIVLSVDALEHDMNVRSLGYGQGVVPDQDISIYVADSKLRKIAKAAYEAAGLDVKLFEGRVLTGDYFISGDKVKDKLVSEFNGLCAEMEGGAIAHAAWLSQIPFLIIRSISDKADNSAHMDYPEFQKIALKNEMRLIKEFFRILDTL